jgi:hypothetical protein
VVINFASNVEEKYTGLVTVGKLRSGRILFRKRKPMPNG